MEKEQKIKILRFIISAVILVLAIVLPLDNLLWLKISLFVISFLICGYDVIIEAFEKIIHGEIFEEEFLMLIASIGAFIIAEYLEAVLIMLLYQIGEFLSDYAVDKSKDSIKALVEIKPDYANVEIYGELVKKSPNEVSVGDIIVVKPGEKVPLDGIVISGSSTIDNSMITGESLPVEIKEKDFVPSGCINKTGLIKINVQKSYDDSTVNKIIKMVEEAQEQKAKQEKFITKFSKIYTPVVVFIALAVFIIPSIITKDWNSWLYKAISMLVVCCPCALVISIPLSYFGGIGKSSKQGILVKGSNYLDSLTKCNTVIFDKTGTITKGVFKISDVVTFDFDKNELIKYASLAEYYSNHPIAESIKKEYIENINPNDISSYKEISGYGVECIVNNQKLVVGNRKLMDLYNIKIDFDINEKGTIVFVSIDNIIKGYIVISDEIKNEAFETIKELKKLNIKSIMLTGDKKDVAEYIAKKVGIDDVYSELLPEDKRKILVDIQKNSSGKVAFVGDGINDAPVISQADIGIAMGAMGSDAAIEASDIVIMDDNIHKIIDAIKISKKTKVIALENIIFSLLVKFAILILGALGITKIGYAIFADVGVLLIATLNAMRTLKMRIK